MHRRPWRTKKKNKRKIGQANKPGQCVSVDQLQSTLPGFMAQIKGKLTHHRYTYATIFVDHYSDLINVVLQKGITGKETKGAK